MRVDCQNCRGTGGYCPHHQKNIASSYCKQLFLLLVLDHHLKMNHYSFQTGVGCHLKLLAIWEVLGPFSNFAIYVGVALYYHISGGCDAIKGHTVGVYKNHSNIYYEAEERWIPAIKNMVCCTKL